MLEMLLCESYRQREGIAWRGRGRRRRRNVTKSINRLYYRKGNGMRQIDKVEMCNCLGKRSIIISELNGVKLKEQQDCI